MAFGTAGGRPPRPPRPPGAGRPSGLPRLPGRPRLLLAVAVTVIVIIVALGLLTGLYTDLLWFRSVGYSQVFTTRLRVEVLLFLVVGAFVAICVAASIVVAYRLRPRVTGVSAEQQQLQRYRDLLTPYRLPLVLVVTGLIGIINGSAASSRWQTWLLWRNGTSFGIADAQFHRDVSYFAFTYPFQRFVLGVAFTTVLLALVAAAATYYLYGGLRFATPGEKVSASARAHLSVLLGLFVVCKAVAYVLDRFGLAFSPRGIVTGPSFTDVNATLPAKTILVFIAVICALLFFANVVVRNWLLPAIAFGLMAVSAIVIGGIYPAIIQQFQVKPSEAAKESPYILRNIDATRQAYGLTAQTVQITSFTGTSSASPATLRRDAAALPGIRLLDPNALSQTFVQLQQIRAFYGFADPLDIDRYPVDGHLQDTVVAVRELDPAGLPQANWINEHLVYTHGYGFVAAPAGTVDAEGKPAFEESNIPPTGVLGTFEPRIYFGETSPDYSIVGGRPNGRAQEIDRPSDTGSGQVNTTYSGTGGVPMGSEFRRLLYALKFKQLKILLTSGVDSHSRILYIRNPRDRIAKVAPWLTLDGDPYPAVVDGRILWIVDGYTTTSGFPYSTQTVLGDVTSDSLTNTQAISSQANQTVNYIRNSVKATVDAYNGTVTLYEWDAPYGHRDPVLATWMKAFPHLVKPESAISPDLLAHLRYPEDLFKVQRALYARYHVGDPLAFYGGNDFWLIPSDPTTQVPQLAQPPYYLTLAVGNEKSAVFSLTSPLLSNNGRNMAAFVSVSSQPGVDYGTIRVLELPRSTQVNGPGQVQNNFESDPQASTTLSLLRQGGSAVVLGNLLTLPIDGSLLYLEPVYVKASSGTAYPTLQRVLVAYGSKIAFQPTLAQALDAIFGTGPPPTSTGTSPVTVTGTNAALTAALAQAEQAYAAGQAALRQGNFAAYGAAQQQLGAALARLAAATRSSSAGSSRASPSPSPSH